MESKKKSSFLRKGSIKLFGISKNDTDKNLEKEFTILMDGMNIQGNQRDAMRKLSKDKKVILLESQKNLAKKKRKSAQINIEDYIRILLAASEPSVETSFFVGLRVNLSTSHIDWVNKFISLKGIETLVNYLMLINQNANADERLGLQELEILRSFRAIVNTDMGENQFYSSTTVYIALCRSLDGMYPETRKLVSEILTYSCYYHNEASYKYLAAGFEEYWKTRQSFCAFYHWVNKLKESASFILNEQPLAKPEEFHDNQESILSNFIFINSFISKNSNLQLRVAFRDELEKAGIQDVITILYKVKDSFLKYQIEKYEQEGLTDTVNIEEVYKNFIKHEVKTIQQASDALLCRVGGENNIQDLLEIYKYILLITPEEWQTKKPLQSVKDLLENLKKNNFDITGTLEQENKDNSKSNKKDRDRNSVYSGRVERLSKSINRKTELDTLEKIINENQSFQKKINELNELNTQLKIDIDAKADGLVGSLRKKTLALEDLLRISRHTIGSLQSQISENLLSKNSKKLKKSNSFNADDFENHESIKSLSLNQTDLLLNLIQKSNINNGIYDSIDEEFKNKANNILDNKDKENNVLDSKNKKDNVLDSKNKENGCLKSKNTMLIHIDKAPDFRDSLEIAESAKTLVSLSPLNKIEFPRNKRKSIYVRKSKPRELSDSFEALKYLASTQEILKQKGISNIFEITESNQNDHILTKSKDDITLSKKLSKKFNKTDSKEFIENKSKNKVSLDSSVILQLVPLKTVLVDPNGAIIDEKSKLSILRAVSNDRKMLRNISKVKLKALHWTKMNNKETRGSFWENLQTIGVDENELEDDMSKYNIFNIIDEKFSEKETLNIKELRKLKKIKEKKEVTILTHKRAHAVNLALGQMKKFSIYNIRNKIIQIDDEFLSKLIISHIKICIPTREEKTLLIGNLNKKDDFAKADRFMTELIGISRIGQRIDCLEFRASWELLVSDTMTDIKKISIASECLFDSKEFIKLLQIILIIGNYMNGSGFRGGAFGFKISSINKIIETKDKSNKTTLLHVLLDVIENNFSNILEFKSQLKPINDACSVSYKEVKITMNRINKNISIIQKEIEECENQIQIDELSENSSSDYEDYLSEDLVETTSNSVDNDNQQIVSLKAEKNKTRQLCKKKSYALVTFVKTFKPFIEKVKKTYDNIEKKANRMMKMYEKATRAFGENPKTTLPEDFFYIIKTFIFSCEKAIRENQMTRKQKIVEEKNRMLLEMKIAQRKVVQESNAKTDKNKKLSTDPKDLPYKENVPTDGNANSAIGILLESLKSPLKETNDIIKKRNVYTDEETLYGSNSIINIDNRSSVIIGAQALNMLRAIRESTPTKQKSKKKDEHNVRGSIAQRNKRGSNTKII
ncbi:hypothetical protein BB561_001397 [Smittium simulii]|uniref:FH2 domain-containing protein n=1 Tax=Smittium simulii TaxID=133385 RepID=A0A2T9YUT0_9FUNG|nr:hypothetical protein BB561_001397 [Smittium simulii]